MLPRYLQAGTCRISSLFTNNIILMVSPLKGGHLNSHRRSLRIAARSFQEEGSLPATNFGNESNSGVQWSKKPKRSGSKDLINERRADIPVSSKNYLPTREMEAAFWREGYNFVAGVDEAGRGPLAGPVVAAACAIPCDLFIEGIKDSKKLGEKAREKLYNEIVSSPGVIHSICVVDREVIDKINILQATMQAMSSCMQSLSDRWTESSQAGIFLVDGNRLPDAFNDPSRAKFVVKGDAKCHVIAAASILAKVTRDRLMLEYDKEWPIYGFKGNKGYGTPSHMEALLKHGPCDIHRRSFAPLKDKKGFET